MMPTGTPAPLSSGALVLGDAEPVASGSIAPNGGKVVFSSSGHPLDGLSIEVPAGSYPDEVTLTVTAREVQGHSLGPHFNPVSPLIEIRGPDRLADEMLTLSIPIEIEEKEFAMAFKYDAGQGEVSGLTLLESTRSKVVAGTWGIGVIRVLVSAIEQEALQGDVDTKFQHGVHDWHIPNFQSYLTSGAVCAGLNLAAIYYFLEDLGPPLYGRYDNHDNGYVSTPRLWNDDEQALRLASVVQNAIDWDNWAFHFWGAYRHWLNDRMTFRALAYALLATGKPQTVSVRGWDADGSPIHHSLICYKKEGTTFFVSDPNFPLGLEGGAEERTITFQDMMSGFQPYRSAAVTGGPAVTFTEVAFWPYVEFLDWSILGQLWDQLERGRVGDSEFPTYELAVREADSEVWEELLPNYESKGKDIVVRARDADFLAILNVRDANGQVLGTNTQVDIGLQDGDNWLGFEVLGGIQEGDSVWLRWVGFDWIKIIHEAPVAVDPTSIDLCELLPPGGEGVRPEGDYGCSQSYKHADGLGSVQVYRIPVGSERACQQYEEGAYNTVRQPLNLGDCGYIGEYADPDSGEVVTGDGAAWTAFFAVGDFRVMVHSGTGAAYPARSDWVMGLVAQVQGLLRQVAGVDS